jgi:hypothetical protein
MIVMCMPRTTVALTYALGAEWYIGAGISVRSPGSSWKTSLNRFLSASRCTSVGASRTTPFGRPVVPEV